MGTAIIRTLDLGRHVSDISLWFKNHFNVFQHINIDTRQICFVTPVWATLQWKSRKID